MTVQAKLVDPNGKPKAIVATHDRLHIGKEFALFSSLINMMAIGSIPTDKLDEAGHQMARLITPEELVERAAEITYLALEQASLHDWSVVTADIDKIYEDAGNPNRTGF